MDVKVHENSLFGTGSAFKSWLFLQSSLVYRLRNIWKDGCGHLHYISVHFGSLEILLLAVFIASSSIFQFELVYMYYHSFSSFSFSVFGYGTSCSFIISKNKIIIIILNK